MSEVIFDLVALLLTLAAAFGYINHKVLKLPHTIGLVVIALTSSFCIIAIHLAFPGWGLQSAARDVLLRVDFSDTLMIGLLSFLLFAGALNLNLDEFLERKWSILTLATVGVLISTALIGGGIWYVFRFVGLDVPLAYCFVFGALISPTDPIAVLGILNRLHMPAGLRTEITGESLFNDGVAIVVFTIAVSIATGAGAGIDFADAALLFAGETLGGAALGLGTGYLAFLVLRSIDEYNVEILVTLALVTGTYGIALSLHVSGPIAVVVSGLIIGNHGTRLAMSETTREHLLQFWSVLDEILNSLLFVLIGFEVLAVSGQWSYALAALLAIPLVLAARVASLAVPFFVVPISRRRGALTILTWGGLHGGISVALALSLPSGAPREVILTVCYGVVIFSIMAQGLTLERVARRFGPVARESPG